MLLRLHLIDGCYCNFLACGVILINGLAATGRAPALPVNRAGAGNDQSSESTQYERLWGAYMTEIRIY